MTDELLPFYQRELSFIRKMGAEFAEDHPEAASALRLGPDSCEDPHVERMIMAFAYLAARIRHKLDDDFPEVTTGLLDVLYPHYLAPIPSMAIVEFQLDRGQAGLAEGYPIARGKELETEPIAGEPCRFRTAYPVTLWPLEVTSASLGRLPPSEEHAPEGATAALRIELQCFSKEMTFSKLKAERLRFFLNGQAQHVFALYELVLNNALDVTLANSGNDPHPVRLGKGCLRPVGFDEEEGILPYSRRSFPGYRILSEYFTFPQKFCFFDVEGLTPSLVSRLGSKVELRLYLNRTTTDLEQNVSGETFRMGCTPIVNLFFKRAEPISLTHVESEYRVFPDRRRPLAMEVYSVDRVTATSQTGEQVEYHPFYSFKHAAARDGRQAFWHSSRRPAGRMHERGDPGTEVYLSLVDLESTTLSPAGWVLDVETTCLNRDLPKRLPFGGGRPSLRLGDGGPFSRIACLTAPTPTLRPPPRKGALWRVISHLSLNHLSIADAQESPQALKEVLKLYDLTDSAETRSKIDGLLKVGSRRVTRPLSSERGRQFCRGVEVNVLFDEGRFSDNSLILFASVLERFLALYCSVNSFSQLVVGTKERKGVLRAWPPRAGDRTLL